MEIKKKFGVLILKMNTTKKNNWLSVCFFLLFCILAFTVSYFHECWLDELQAWAISKESIYNILFVIPHIECHVPLWHLILKLFSHFNLSHEIGLKLPNLLFMIATVWLIIFKSPFPNIIKLTLPFTFFLFYQHTIINRPYCILSLGLILCAYLYKNRNDNPFKFVSTLAITSLSGVFGMFLSTGIILAWALEILNKRNIFSFLKEFVKDKRFFAMLLIFFLNLILTFIIFPCKDATPFDNIIKTDMTFKFIYTFFVLPIDALFYNILPCHDISFFHIDFKSFIRFYDIPKTNFFIIKFWFGVLLGFIVNIILFCYFKTNKKLLLFSIPYIMYLLMCSFGYFSSHHMGILTIFYIFAFWCTYDNSNKPELDQKNYKLKSAINILIIISIIMQLYWSVSCIYNEIKYSYSPSKEAAEFILNYDLDKYKIMAEWLRREYHLDKSTHKYSFGNTFKNIEELEKYNDTQEKILDEDLKLQFCALEVIAYFNKNIFYNYNIDNPKRQYLELKHTSKEENEQIKQKLKEMGKPDFVLGSAYLQDIFDNEKKISKKYKLLKTFSGKDIFKNYTIKKEIRLFIRDDFYEKEKYKFNKIYIDLVNNKITKKKFKLIQKDY